MSLDEQRPHHEKFAESFEQYLFEGKAPSRELGSLFGRFRAWLTNVYRSLQTFMASYNTNLSDEVRGGVRPPAGHAGADRAGRGRQRLRLDAQAVRGQGRSGAAGALQAPDRRGHRRRDGAPALAQPARPEVDRERAQPRAQAPDEGRRREARGRAEGSDRRGGRHAGGAGGKAYLEEIMRGHAGSEGRAQGLARPARRGAGACPRGDQGEVQRRRPSAGAQGPAEGPVPRQEPQGRSSTR
jgi:hypothetical protein